MSLSSCATVAVTPITGFKQACRGSKLGTNDADAAGRGRGEKKKESCDVVCSQPSLSALRLIDLYFSSLNLTLPPLSPSTNRSHPPPPRPPPLCRISRRGEAIQETASGGAQRPLHGYVHDVYTLRYVIYILSPPCIKAPHTIDRTNDDKE